MQYTKLFMACFAAMAMASCSKKDEDKTPSPTPATSKIVGTWKCISAKGDKPLGQYADGRFGYDYYEDGVLPDCSKDNLTIFYDGGKFSLDEGKTKCDPSSPQLYGSGNWSIKGDTLELTNSGGQPKQSRITQLDDATFKLEWQEKDFHASLLDGDTTYASIIFTSTYTRQ